MKKSAATPSFRPLYEQIKILLTQSLVAGEWKPGEAIPSEIELAARYRVSQGTVRKAIDVLSSEHILVRRQGKGTFVASHNEPSYQYRFLRVVPDSGEKPHPKNLFFALERGKASGEAARALGLKPGSATMGFKRVMSFEGRPVILDEIVFEASQFPGLTLAELEEFNGSVYSFYESVFGVRMIRAEERLRAVAADSVAAAHLKVAAGAPLLCVDRIAFTYGDKPVEWRRGLCVTDGFSYFNELS
ncbi:MAG: GntR family transcriptional regulator [Pseudomonadota bacterium]|nr:GntR family transcriptional regulator [Pseudomonadota bacterium]